MIQTHSSRPHAHYVRRPGQGWKWLSQMDADRLYAAMTAHPAAHEGVTLAAVLLPHVKPAMQEGQP